MAKLQVAPDLKLPLEAVTETFAVLGKRGTGKTYTAGVLVEELIKAGQHTVIIDPTDAWWGLRSSADGKGPGLPVVIFGGPHGDLPLVEQDAEILARAIVEQSITCVLSLRHLSKKARLRFLGPLLEQLYHLKAEKREPLMLVVDEADRVAPQKLMKGEGQERVLGAIDEIVRMGRSSGFGVLLITQRSAVISKDVLSQTEVLICTRTISPQDIAAVDAWISEHDVEEQRETFLSSLPALPNGDSWWWSPGWLELFKHTRVREKETFDSSYTPRAGEKPRAPKRIADIDLTALKAQLAKTIEREQQRDPSHLQKRIQELERDLKRQTAAAPAKPDPDAIAKSRQQGREDAMRDFRKILEPELRKLGNRVTSAAAAVANARQSCDAVVEYSSKFLQLLTPNESAPTSPSSPRPAGYETAVTVGQPGGPITRPGLGASTPSHFTVAPREPRVGGSLSRGMRRILDALAELEAYGIRPASRTQVGVIAGYNLSGGAASGYVGDLTDAGLVSIPGAGRLELTDAGRAQANPPSEALTLADVHQRALAKLGTGERKILECLLSVYPETLTREQVGEATGYTVSGGAASGYVGKLVTLEFAEIPQPGCLRAGKVLFPEGLR